MDIGVLLAKYQGGFEIHKSKCIKAAFLVLGICVVVYNLVRTINSVAGDIWMMTFTIVDCIGTLLLLCSILVFDHLPVHHTSWKNRLRHLIWILICALQIFTYFKTTKTNIPTLAVAWFNFAFVPIISFDYDIFYILSGDTSKHLFISYEFNC